MKKAIKILVLFLILSAANLPVSDSYMFDQESASGNFFSAGCWSPPTKPALVYPSDNYVADPNSAWKANPYMDWEDSVAQCPETAVHHYIYESYHDEALTSLAYRSGELLLSQIPAPGTPDGEYYWRVMACDALRCSDWSDVWHLTVTSVVVETVQTGSQEESHNETQTPLLSIELFSDLAEQQSIYESATLVGEESQNDEESTEVGGNPNTKTSGDLQEVNNNLTSENEETI